MVVPVTCLVSSDLDQFEEAAIAAVIHAEGAGSDISLSLISIASVFSN